jgi:hypothetical protein
MNTADERSRAYDFNDVGDDGVRVVGGWDIIERKKYSDDDLRDKEEEQPGAEDVGLTGASRNRLVERLVQDGIDAGALIEPVVQLGCNVGVVGRLW